MVAPEAPAPRRSPTAYEMGFDDYIRILRKRWRIVVLTIVAGLFGAAAYSSTLPRVFRASAQFEIQPPREAVLAGLKYRGPMPDEVVRSMGAPEFTERVALRLLEEGVFADTASAREGARAGVSITRSAQEGRGSNVVTVTVSSEYPDRCAKVANAYVDEAVLFVADYLQEQRKHLRRYLLFRLEGAETAVEAANQALQEHRRLEEEVRASEEALRKLEEERRSLAALAAEREEVVRRLDSAEAATEIRSSDPNVRTLVGRLADLQGRRGEILARYTPSHPEIGSIGAEIARLMPRLRRAVEEAYGEAESKWTDLLAREAAARTALEEAKAALDRMENPYILQQRATLQFQQFGTIASKLEEERFMDALQDEGSIEVTAKASVPSSPSSPSYRLHVTAGGTIGLLVGLALVFVLETLDTSIGTIEDVEAYLGLPVLGVIPFIRPTTPAAEAAQDEKGRLREGSTMGPMLITYHQPNSVPAEAFRALRTHILSLIGDGRHKAFLLTSSGPQEGKSTTTSNLASTFARTGMRTLLVEANMRRPTSHKIFQVPRSPGLSEALMGADWRPFVREVAGIPNLSLLTAGAPPTVNPAELLLRPRLAELLDEMRPAYDFVLVDAPPVLPVADPTIVAQQVDEVILIYYVGKAAREAILRAKTHLAQAGGKFRGHLLGVVLNHVQPEAQAGYYYYYYHSRYYGA